jgi:hypothetical protein
MSLTLQEIKNYYEIINTYHNSVVEKYEMQFKTFLLKTTKIMSPLECLQFSFCHQILTQLLNIVKQNKKNSKDLADEYEELEFEIEEDLSGFGNPTTYNHEPFTEEGYNYFRDMLNLNNMFYSMPQYLDL